MKIRFDTNTKELTAALAAFSALYPYTKELNMSVSSWNEDVINLYGEIDSSHIGTVQNSFPDGTFSEEVDKL